MPKDSWAGMIPAVGDPVTGHNPSDFLYDLSFGIRVNRELEKNGGDSNGHTSWVS